MPEMFSDSFWRV